MKFFLYGLAALALFFWAESWLLEPGVNKNSPEASSLTANEGKPDIQDKKFVEIAGTRINVKTATTPEEREKGLSGSEKLQDNEGLLFIFDEPGEYVFWMKDMNFAIDIIWILESENGDKRIAYIRKDARPDSYPETFGDGVIAKYVLEVNSGFSEKNNLREGDKVLFSL